MKKIVIIGGRYGYISPSGVYSVKTTESAPFDVADSEAERLVKIGVAKIHGEGGKCPETSSKAKGKGSSNTSGEENLTEGNSGGICNYDEKTSANDLRKIAKKAGISFPVGVTKADMLTALDEHFARVDGDDGLDLGVEPPVV